MRTDQLIEELAQGARPRSPAAALRRLSGGISLGAMVSALTIFLMLGQPLQAVGLTGIPAFTMKLLFTASMTVMAGLLLFASGRPGRKVGSRIYWLLLPPALVAVTAAMELAGLSQRAQEAALLGSTWQTCLVGVSALSLPVLLGTVWGFRYLAPTQLRLAGSLAGLTSGSTAAFLYALYCPETTATFLVSWYTLGILAAGVVGALAGPRLLRW